jgi:hypothetical protein
VWHRASLALRGVDGVYSISSVVFIAFAVIRARGSRDDAERTAFWTSAATVGVAFASLAVLSTVFDFGDRLLYPSPRWPYFSGRLISGILVPFVTLYLYGLEWGLAKVRLRGAALPMVGGLAILATASQLAATVPVFRSQYNWFHLPWGVTTGSAGEDRQTSVAPRENGRRATLAVW